MEGSIRFVMGGERAEMSQSIDLIGIWIKVDSSKPLSFSSSVL